MKTKLMHVRINVKDINVALKWYTEILEFEQDGSGYPHNKPIFYGFKSNGGADFSIMEVRNEKSYGRFNFNVGNEIDTLWEKLKDKVAVIEPLFDTPWGTRKFTIADPDGNELGFCK